jgi:hypothetical protein
LANTALDHATQTAVHKRVAVASFDDAYEIALASAALYTAGMPELALSIANKLTQVSAH